MARLQWALLLVLLGASSAAAQQVDGSGVPYRAWDINAAFGFHTSAESDLSGQQGMLGGSWEPAWAGSFDVGRYWTSHVKTEAGLAHFSGMQYYASEPILGTTGQQIGQIFSTTDVRQTQVVLAGTYQFLENAFAHPYVSAGARIGFLDYRTYENRYLYSSLPPNGLGPAEERQGVDVRVRPFVGAGSKSYFSERVFIRPEMVMAFDGTGLAQFGLRLGLGLDF